MRGPLREGVDAELHGGQDSTLPDHGPVCFAAGLHANMCSHGTRGGHPPRGRRRLCPDLVVVRPRFDAYVEASRAMFAIFERAAAVVERVSIEEAFLDVRAAPEDPTAIARRLRAEVREEVGLAVSVGVASTKMLAKIASRAAKPDGLLAIAPGDEAAFLHPLPVDRIWGVGAKTARRLQAHGLATVGDLARLSQPQLMAVAGRATGRFLHAVAHNRDHRRVRRRRGRRSFGAQRALGRGPHGAAELDEALASLADRLSERMGKAGRAGRTVTLRLRFGDYTRATRSRTLARPTAAREAVLLAARGLLRDAEPLIARRGVTLVGITVGAIEPDPGAAQLRLPLDDATAAAPPTPPATRR
ncbi:MAG TPA: DNA polymerase IV [Capillimicrobium sp.]|nr:DNA polymerase IV [Capillimicrobium sp.]